MTAGMEHQAITNQERLPRAPGPGATVARCQCGKMLGIICGAHLFVRHEGRELTATLPVDVHCERCGRRTLVRAG